MFSPAFNASQPESALVEIFFEGESLRVPAHFTVAAAVLTKTHVCRCSAISESLRGPWCLMGICYDCLMEINNEPNQQTCLRLVEPGMTIKRQAIPSVTKASSDPASSLRPSLETPCLTQDCEDKPC